MNRVVKTAIAVTVFGLAAAAMAVPAQAELRYDTARHAAVEGPGGGTTAAGSPLGGLLGGLTGGSLLGGLLGAAKTKVGAHPAAMTEAQRDAAAEHQAEFGTTANAAEDVTRTGGPIPELSPIVGGFEIPLSGKSALGGSLPMLGGAARMAQPGMPKVKADTSAQGVAQGVGAFSADAVLGGLSAAARHALPTVTGGGLSPALGKVAPAEMAPVVEALPATSQAASMDELAPLVEQGTSFVEARGVKAVGSYGDVITALGWTTDALTSSVRNTWARD